MSWCSDTPRGSSDLSCLQDFLLTLTCHLGYKCWCDERLRVKTERSTHLTYTGLCGGLENLKIETRSRDEKFKLRVKGECVM